MVDPLTQTYFQAVALRLNNCLLLELKRCIVAPKLPIEFFPLKFVNIFSHEDVFWKNRDEHTKSKISSLSWREIWHSVLKVEDWYVPTHILRRQNNLGKTYPTIAPFRLVLEFLCLVCHHLIHMYPAELCKLSESKKPTERPRAMSSHPYIKFHVVTTQTPLQNEVVFYHSGNGTLQNCHCFLAVWLAGQCHGR